jgi:DNA-binding HxlR family transcriptional regulator
MEHNQCGCCITDGSPPTTAEPVCYCPVDELLDIVTKERALAIISLLANDGPRRHSEIADALDVTSSSVLAARLRELTEAGLIDRTSYDRVPPHVEYSLSAAGREFERRLRPLLQWKTQDGIDTE